MPTSMYLLAGALGGFAGGPLADRFGRRNLILASMLLCVPFVLGFLLLHGPLSWASLFLGGAILQLSLPVNVVYARSGVIDPIKLLISWAVTPSITTSYRARISFAYRCAHRRAD